MMWAWGFSISLSYATHSSAARGTWNTQNCMYYPRFRAGCECRIFLSHQDEGENGSMYCLLRYFCRVHTWKRESEKNAREEGERIRIDCDMTWHFLYCALETWQVMTSKCVSTFPVYIYYHIPYYASRNITTSICHVKSRCFSLMA